MVCYEILKLLFIFKERIDQHVGQVLAYGALLKSGRLTGKEEMLLVINQLIIGSKIKSYIQPVAYGFLEELCQQVKMLLRNAINATFYGNSITNRWTLKPLKELCGLF